jgi:hypothetical protein
METNEKPKIYTQYDMYLAMFGFAVIGFGICLFLFDKKIMKRAA